jgi:hypothetical protein
MMGRRTRILLLVGVLGGLSLGVVEPWLPPNMNPLIATVKAIIGRPLTPVSVAGVARRTARRCAVGVYC